MSLTLPVSNISSFFPPDISPSLFLFLRRIFCYKKPTAEETIYFLTNNKHLTSLSERSCDISRPVSGEHVVLFVRYGAQSGPVRPSDRVFTFRLLGQVEVVDGGTESARYRRLLRRTSLVADAARLMPRRSCTRGPVRHVIVRLLRNCAASDAILLPPPVSNVASATRPNTGGSALRLPREQRCGAAGGLVPRSSHPRSRGPEATDGPET
ncbi:Hypothetical protein SMAX5B_021791 [Scophthalmus maximus]|uniref:Uncharacterized protein n=1 Tax=Scophthalmus maximus TaxID=52904 RepID=A0A2U9CJN4_SCOMX|nr:Hypothetical protein SMAX5B_021791 [Scophthalmus maximus]